MSRIIPPLSLLPEPDRLGEAAGGWTSRIWIRGRYALRIRSLGSSSVCNELEDGSSTREVTGSLGFVVRRAQEWFKKREEA